MDQKDLNQLPEVSIYSIGPKEADYAAPLLTPEAVSLIQTSEAFALALTEEGTACAAVCARLAPENETILEVISLYVAPEFRRRSLGRTLLIELLERTMAATDGSIRFLTISFLSEDHGLSAMLSKFGFEIIPEETAISWQLTLEKLPDSILMKTPAALPSNSSLQSLAALSDYQIRQLAQTLKSFHVDILSAAQLHQAHQQASYVLLGESGEPTACAIFTVSDHSRITLSQFFTAHKSASPIVAVLQASAQILLEQFSPETILEIPTLTRSSGKLVQHLLPESKAISLNRAVLDLGKV